MTTPTTALDIAQAQADHDLCARDRSGHLTGPDEFEAADAAHARVIAWHLPALLAEHRDEAGLRAANRRLTECLDTARAATIGHVADRLEQAGLRAAAQLVRDEAQQRPAGVPVAESGRLL